MCIAYAGILEINLFITYISIDPLQDTKYALSSGSLILSQASQSDLVVLHD